MKNIIREFLKHFIAIILILWTLTVIFAVGFVIPYKILITILNIF